MNPPRINALLELHVPDFEKLKDCHGKLSFGVIRERKP